MDDTDSIYFVSCDDCVVELLADPIRKLLHGLEENLR